MGSNCSREEQCSKKSHVGSVTWHWGSVMARNYSREEQCSKEPHCKGNLQTRGDRDSKESGKSIKTKQDSKQLATVGGFQ